ncbi:FUSC family protein [Agromyces protaetiae]|uniref:FUSC family protein n=1 Tax=Agromyces protaetiae TaxID=2509455 RepID=A0A4P6FCM3_9MICO|nr:FUSC family protein [Agromyces protaetiae]QAY72703.1 FUSC family protein [Agromyces protaetiae]
MASGGAGLTWSWRNFAVGIVFGAPAAIATAIDPSVGLPLAVGVLPAAILGMRGPRAERVRIILIGFVAGASMFVGSLLAPLPIVAVPVIFALCVLVAGASADAHRRLAPLNLALGLPLVGAGLSVSSPASGALTGLLLLTGSVYAWLVSLLWPSIHDDAPRPPRRLAQRAAMVRYGVQIGLAAAVAAALGFALGADHPGWGVTAALLVSRPDEALLHSRGLARSIAVVAGAIVACAVAAFEPSGPVLALLAVAALAGAAATSGSRWYVTAFFSTIIVLSLLELSGEHTSSYWFAERVGLTLAGVALAFAAAWIAPRVGHALRARHRSIAQ